MWTLILGVILSILLVPVIDNWVKSSNEKEQAIRKQNEHDAFINKNGQILPEIKKRYNQAAENISIPQDAELIEMETTILGIKKKINNYTFKDFRSFLFWKDGEKINIFPSQKYKDEAYLEEGWKYTTIEHSYLEDIKLISVDISSIIYYALHGKKETHVAGGNNSSPNTKGAIAGGVLGGTTGAIIGSTIPQRPTMPLIWDTDDRCVELAYDEAGFIKKLKLGPNTYPLLMEWIPEKEYSQVEYRKTCASDDDSKIQQLKKYKGLLDDGIITETDFEAKKRELLNIGSSYQAETERNPLEENFPLIEEAKISDNA